LLGDFGGGIGARRKGAGKKKHGSFLLAGDMGVSLNGGTPKTPQNDHF